MSTVRLRRLAADYAKLQDYVRRHPRVRLVQADGDPPERYQIEYRIRSVRMVAGELQPVQSHLVEVTLPRNYPRTPPQCRMLSPVFHPNIAPHAICVGDHWSAGESLQSIITRIGEMLAYQSYNVKSPLNGEAARWVEQNKDRVPLDPVSLLVDEARDGHSQATPPQPATMNQATPRGVVGDKVARQSPAPPSVSPTRPPLAQSHVACPGCRASYRVAANFLGRQVRCKSCGELFVCVARPGTAPAGDGKDGQP
ncbi:MAG: ubiquitin-conjugating enzyme E2 [Pirellulales bacterium]